MSWQTLIDVASLRTSLSDPRWIVIDCRFDLARPGWGEQAWQEGHIPGARYAHLDRDLSDLGKRGCGRHPLPEADAFCASLVRWGVRPAHQVVVYDAGNGMFAARLWWMLRLLGHRDVAVLDGGLAAWHAEGGELSMETPTHASGEATGSFDARQILSSEAVADGLAKNTIVLLDARAGERFRGEVEPLDPRAGHIPGAINVPFAGNLAPDGRFLAPELLASRFASALSGRSAQELVHMCGSGVTACHNVLAMEHAGLHGSRVYAGSWSAWCNDPARPVATGETEP